MFFCIQFLQERETKRQVFAINKRLLQKKNQDLKKGDGPLKKIKFIWILSNKMKNFLNLSIVVAQKEYSINCQNY